MSTNAITETDELVGIALQIHAWQTARGLSDSEMLRRFSNLGSTKTYKKIRDGHLEQLNIETQLANYQAAWSVIESVREDAVTEVIYEDFRAVLELKKAFLETTHTTGINRLIILQGQNSTGKTTARKVLQKKYGGAGRIVCVEASVSWNDNPMAMMDAILELFQKSAPPSGYERQGCVINALSARRCCLIIEEAHHLGPKCLNFVKTLINNTPGEFILVAIDTLWRKLETAVYEDARQLTGNRLASRIQLRSEYLAGDVRKMLANRLRWASDADFDAALKTCVERMDRYGALAFVRDVIERIRIGMDEHDLVNLEAFGLALTAEIKSR